MNVTVVIPAYNEEKSIGLVVADFIAHKRVGEVIVIDNNSQDQTAKIAKELGAKVHNESILGYGSAIKSGIRIAKEELICVVEADSTFKSTDLDKLLAYYQDANVVLGSRTSKILIWQDAYMPGWVRWGNWFVGKLVEIFFNGSSLTDAGCTYKLISKDIAHLSLKYDLTDGNHYNAQFLIFLCKNKIPFIEIPVNYYPRIGDSKITGGDSYKTFKLGLKMIYEVFLAKFNKGKLSIK